MNFFITSGDFVSTGEDKVHEHVQAKCSLASDFTDEVSPSDVTCTSEEHVQGLQAPVEPSEREQI